MSHRKKAVSASNAAHQQPVAPDDFWEVLDAEVSKIPEPPRNAFNFKEFRERYNLGKTAAQNRISRLIQEEKIECIGTFGAGSAKYYKVRNGK